MEKKKTSKSRKLLALILVPLGFFVLLELILRIMVWTGVFSHSYYFPNNIAPTTDRISEKGDSLYVLDPQLLWRLNPGIAGEFPVEGKDKPIYIRINKNHYRGELVGEKKSPDELRILVLGDSSSFGWGVEEQESYGDVLRESLSRKMPQKNVKLINLGVPGYSSSQMKRLMQKEGWDYQPDILIVSCGFNDYRRQQLLPDSAYMKPDNLINTLKSLLNKTMIYKSLVALVNEIRKGKEVNYFDSPRVPPQEFEGNLMDLAKEGKARGVIVLFAPISTAPEYRRLMQKVARQEHVGWVQTEEALEKAYQKLVSEGEKGEYSLIDDESRKVYLDNRFFDDWMMSYRLQNIIFLDPVHPNPRGHAVIAQAILDELETQKLLP